MATLRSPNSKLPLMALLAFGLTCSLSMAGAHQAMFTPKGDLVQVDEVGALPGSAPTALRVSIQGPSGELPRISILPGTEDTAFDAYPALVLDPITGNPAVVWSRHNGTDYDLALSVFDGARWGNPIILNSNAGNQIVPRAFPAPGEGLHVVWNYPGDRSAFSYALFDTTTGAMLQGPERIDLRRKAPRMASRKTGGRGGFVPEGGGDDPGIQPDPTDPPIGLGSGNDTKGDGTNDGCTRQGMCSKIEAGTVATHCGGLSITVEIGRRTCLVTRGDSGWTNQGCFSSRAKGSRHDLGPALVKLAGNSCSP